MNITRPPGAARPAPSRAPTRPTAPRVAVTPAPGAKPTLGQEVAGLRTRLAVADETLRAIRSGEVDAMLVAGKQGDKVFSLEGAGHAYRKLIESMNEGALMLTADKVILYANPLLSGY